WTSAWQVAFFVRAIAHHGRVRFQESPMRSPIVLRLFIVLSSLAASVFATAGEEERLLESINSYRAEVQRCSGEPSEILPPLSVDERLVLSVGAGGLEEALGRSGYTLANVRAIN